MPTLPLYRTDAAPDSWHQVKSPGGYEWWRFEAFDAQSNRRLALDFFDGDPFNPAYLEQHQAYLDRPTKNPPPTPADFPTVNVAVYDGEQPTARHIFQYSPCSFVGQPDGVTLGPNQLHREADGSVALHLSLPAKTVANVQLTFTPIGVSNTRETALLPSEAGFGVHRWITSAAGWDVNGSINGHPFNGVGFFDHAFGDQPLATSLTALLRGWIRTSDGAVAFAAVQPFDSDHCAGWTLENGELSQVNAVGLKRPFGKLGYPQSISLGDGLTLQSPRVLASEPARLRLVYAATWRGRAVEANCELALPRRWKWPTIGRLARTPITVVGK